MLAAGRWSGDAGSFRSADGRLVSHTRGLACGLIAGRRQWRSLHSAERLIWHHALLIPSGALRHHHSTPCQPPGTRARIVETRGKSRGIRASSPRPRRKGRVNLTLDFRMPLRLPVPRRWVTACGINRKEGCLRGLCASPHTSTSHFLH